MKKNDKANCRYKYLLDNVVIHKTKIISENLRKNMIYNIPYSPQFNPIEYVNNELKRQIKLVEIIIKKNMGDILKSV